MSKIYLEILDNNRLDIFNKLKSFKIEGCLAGGTALALQLNHRISEDFDVFINREIDNKLRLKVKEIFGDVTFYVNTTDQITFITQNGVKVTFLWYYFEPLNPTLPTTSLSLASIDDIAIDKAHTIGRRAVWRDYVDVFYLLKNKHTDLDKIIHMTHKKFKGEFVPTQFLEQLRYFDDVKTAPIEYIEKKYTDDEIKLYLQQTVADYLKKVL
ncbi:MAG: nucleotidyl transferase AbiEii/AbiGii toxin family protein [bacterium]|nr:nucleotidyl transferase AbiEii/AbiGii toxin family protein [bacterium]